jgi:hypothetical protein
MKKYFILSLILLFVNTNIVASENNKNAIVVDK